MKGREEILKVHARNKPLGFDVDLNKIARTTAGFTGADLENLLNEAALLAAKHHRKAIIEADIEAATVKVVAGPEKRSHKISDKDKRITAFHEAGHAVVTYHSPTQDEVHEVSIIPRGMAAGYTMHLPAEDRMHMSRRQMREELSVLLAGRVAEEIALEDICTGASNDIERATKIARAMVTKYGFSEKLGPITYGSEGSNPFLGKEMGHVSNYSEQTASEIDEEIQGIISRAYGQTESILKEHMDELHRLAAVLFEREKVDAGEFQQVMAGTLLPGAAPVAELGQGAPEPENQGESTEE